MVLCLQLFVVVVILMVSAKYCEKMSDVKYEEKERSIGEKRDKLTLEMFRMAGLEFTFDLGAIMAGVWLAGAICMWAFPPEYPNHELKYLIAALCTIAGIIWIGYYPSFDSDED